MSASRPPLSSLARWARPDAGPVPAEVEAALRQDPRAGAQAIVAAIETRRRKRRAEGQRLRWMLRHERPLWEAGLRHVAGVDEAGMAPLAGPVFAAAVILAPGTRLPEVDDSKKLAPEVRERLAEVIRREALGWAVGVATVEDIDALNIYYAGLLAMRRAVEALPVAPEALLLDARRLPELAIPQHKIVHGDALSLSIAAASILAKTARDAFMVALDARHPGYGFARHKGYPVPEHRAALARLGPCVAHRRAFVTRTAAEDYSAEP